MQETEDEQLALAVKLSLESKAVEDLYRESWEYDGPLTQSDRDRKVNDFRALLAQSHQLSREQLEEYPDIKYIVDVRSIERELLKALTAGHKLGFLAHSMDLAERVSEQANRLVDIRQEAWVQEQVDPAAPGPSGNHGVNVPVASAFRSQGVTGWPSHGSNTYHSQYSPVSVRESTRPRTSSGGS